MFHTILALSLLAGFSAETTGIGPVEDYQVLAPKLKKDKIQLSLQEAALQGYRFAGAAVRDRAFTVMSRPKGWSGGARFEYSIITTIRGSTLDKELSAAYQEGWRLRDLIGVEINNPPFAHLAVLEKEIGKPSGAEEIRLVHAQKSSTLEKGLQQAASEGFRFTGISENLYGYSAVMMRPADARQEPRFSYRITDKPDEVIAEGYRPAKPFHSVVAGHAILEKDAQMVPEKAAVKLVAPSRKSTLLRQLEEAASGGYRLAAMDGFWRILWVKYPDRAEAAYSYYLVEANSEGLARITFAAKVLEGFSFVAVQVDVDSYQLVFERPRQP